MNFTVYTRPDCPLCDRLLAELQFLCRDRTITIRVVDVDQDVALQRRHHERVPVLLADGEELCHHRLDPSAVRRRLAACHGK